MPGVSKIPPKRYIVAIDGSKLGFRAARFAAFLCRPMTGDKVELVSIWDETHTEEKMKGHLATAKNDLVALGFRTIDTKTKMKSSSGIAGTLCEAASGGILVMGSGGMRLQEEWLKKKSTTPAAATGSVAQACMSTSKAPVIICKSKAAPMIDKDQFIRQRKTTGMSILVAVTENLDPMAIKCFDMAKRVSQRADLGHVVHVRTTTYNKKTDLYWEAEVDKANMLNDGTFQYKLLENTKGDAIDKTINKYCEHDEVLADLVIMSSQELTKLDGQALGSVSAAVAKNTEANVMISKHFAQ